MSPRVRTYAEQAASSHGVSVCAVLGRDRTKLASKARGDVMFRLAKDGISPSQIGRWLKRDHSTVLYHIAKRISSTG